ncbi:MAG: nuclear transport factor 2 family protein [Acidimicrobiales bacterium]|nr:nuclear transport factor 2 family protein [Acidimicrobiales bacterium]RZV46365.1 MAG: nuclear transport factor 2 family protein [Acidimicrobiales bacterium]
MNDPAVQRLVDIEAIKVLKAKYCWYCDDPEKYELFPTLFTEDAVFIEEPLDHLDGRPAITKWNEEYPEFCVWSTHYATTPLIEVDGDTATGRWQALLMSMQRVDGREVMLWATGRYVEKYRRVEGEWLFSNIHASGKWMTSFDDGFGDDVSALS